MGSTWHRGLVHWTGHGHYRCHQVFTAKTKAECITDTVQFFPQKTSVPYLTNTEIAIQAATDLATALRTPILPHLFPNVGHAQLDAIRQIAELFQQEVATSTKAPPHNKVTKTIPHPVPLPRVERPNNHNPNEEPPNHHWYPTRHSQRPREHQAHNVQLQPITSITQNTIWPEHTPDEPQWANAIIDPATGAAMEYRHLVKSEKHKAVWTHSFANELG